ncbi:MAG: AzlC family ABC transporter permease [Candidatus Acinetobacter avistercoris]|uniref:AzlC family ABC transporter permease n=1 Tax=Acinetobacter sp. KS-LM10 TaxID=3120518 RepID=UPI001F865352|nr:AzlC family ABC transporter permease [Candidatus Acinetobacter avistercoris]
MQLEIKKLDDDPSTHKSFHQKAFYQGVLDILPLSIAVLPWAILAGSMAVNAGLSVAQAFAMSAVLFAGAAQLVSLGLVMSGASFYTIVITVFFISAQHFIYALNFRQDVMSLPLRKRVLLGFLLTDELFAVGITQKAQRSFAYLFGAGSCFYLAWCLFSLIGIFLANVIPNLDQLHLDFSIVAVFICIIVPMIKNAATLIGVVTTLLSALVFHHLRIEAGTVLAGLLGMFAAMSTARLLKHKSLQRKSLGQKS